MVDVEEWEKNPSNGPRSTRKGVEIARHMMPRQEAPDDEGRSAACMVGNSRCTYSFPEDLTELTVTGPMGIRVVRGHAIRFIFDKLFLNTVKV
jgi:hypothetical protein